MNRTKTKHAILVAAAVVLFAGAALSASTALAAKPSAGGGGHKGGGQTTGSGSCVISPNPLAYGTYATLNGSGFAPNTTVGYSVSGAGGIAMGFTDSDGSGNVSMSMYGGWLGTNTVTFTGGPTCTFNVV